MISLFMVLACSPVSMPTPEQTAFCEALCPPPVAAVKAWEISGGVKCECIYRFPALPRTEVK
jgi:hypothetical protein